MDLLTVVLLTLTPALELRASIPYGLLATDLPVALVLGVVVLTNIIIGLVVFGLLHLVLTRLREKPSFERRFQRTLGRAQHRVHRAVERWGVLGIAVFIGIPLPGSGVFTAAVGSYLLGVSFKHFAVACVLGVLLAAAAVTLIVLSGSALFGVGL